MSRESDLRRKLAWSASATFAGIALATTASETLGAIVTLPAMAVLILTIHQFGRLGDD